VLTKYSNKGLMKKLIQGLIDFQAKLTDEYCALFAKLALGQHPDALFSACSDSRVVPKYWQFSPAGQ